MLHRVSCWNHACILQNPDWVHYESVWSFTAICVMGVVWSPYGNCTPNGHLAVNCTGFGCTIKCYLLITPEFHRIFLWKVLHMAINIMDHFYMTTKFSKHEHVTINYHILIIQDIIMSTSIVIYKCFNLCSTLYEMNCHVRYFVWEKFAYLCDYWQKSCCTTKNFFSNVHFYHIFGLLAVQFP